MTLPASLAIVASVLVLFLTLFGDSVPNGLRLTGSVVAVIIACGSVGYSVARLRNEK
ncbi:hypothetical protein ACNHUS_22130 [Actinomycetes bacterium M1A6_2h]